MSEEQVLLTEQHLIHAANHLPDLVMDGFDPDCWICRQSEIDMLIFDACMILAGCDIHPEQRTFVEEGK